jgi:hypothetical protein
VCCGVCCGVLWSVLWSVLLNALLNVLWSVLLSVLLNYLGICVHFPHAAHCLLMYAYVITFATHVLGNTLDISGAITVDGWCIDVFEVGDWELDCGNPQSRSKSK